MPNRFRSHDLDCLGVTQQLVLADDRFVEFGAVKATPLNYRGLNFVLASSSDNPLLKPDIKELLMTQQLHFLLYLLLANTFVITCQDIAVDSWSVEILTPEHASYQSGAQAIG